MISSIDTIFLSTTVKIFSFVNATNNIASSTKRNKSPPRWKSFGFRIRIFIRSVSLCRRSLYSLSNSLFASQLFATSIFSGIDSIPQKSPIETKPYLWHGQTLHCSLSRLASESSLRRERDIYTSQSRRSLPRQDPVSRASSSCGE